MSVSFKLRTLRKKGTAALTARIQSNKLGVNLLVRTPIMVDIEKYSAPPYGRLHRAYLSSGEGLRAERLKLDITDAINSRLLYGEPVNYHLAREIINDIYYGKDREILPARPPGRGGKMTLRAFTARFIDDIGSGRRLTDRGTVYSPGTVRAIRQACDCLRKFEARKRCVFDFNDIDIKFHKEYTAFLTASGYAVNTVGKCIKVLKQIMSLAESEGLHSNSRFKDKRFRGIRVEVDSIYLTKDELRAMTDVDLSGMSYGYELARDIFLVGVWTAQRVSDYDAIRPEDIHVKIAGKTGARSGRARGGSRPKEKTYIDIRQKKTGARVTIPCSSELKRILEKYGYNIPRLSHQHINAKIKTIGKMAGLTAEVTVTRQKDGRTVVCRVPKYKLICSHTARRTGATLMYLSGMEIYDIMKITGHTTPAMLKKYIKADKLEVAEKISDKYDYFD